jgi:hypothetical protein
VIKTITSSLKQPTKTKLIVMGTLKNNLRPFGSLVPSGARSTNTKIINRVCAALFTGIILFGGNAKAQFPYNVLINPGAETGDLTGWNTSLSGYIFVVSTNNIIPGSTNNILAHSGTNTFQMFDVTADSAYMYQDYAAIAGSQWSASVWAICYASNYFDTAFAYMSVGFYDANGNVVLTDTNNPDPGTVAVYGSVVLDPNAPGFGVGWIIPPTPAIDATGWLYLPATNFYYDYTPVNTNGVPGANIESGMAIQVSTNLTAPPGTAFVRYQLEYDNLATAGGDIYWDNCQLNKLNQTDPDITNPQPAGVSCYVGDPASFTVHALKGQKREVLTYQWQKNGTNLPPVPGGEVVGNSTNASLLFADCQVSDSGMYSCLVSDTNGSIRSVPVPLTVTPPPCPTVNRLSSNAGFENAPVWSPWNYFNGCALVSPSFVFDGKWCAMVGENGDRDNGFWQVIKGVTPGSVWKAGGWAYISSANDFAGANTCRIQIWFKDANGNIVPGTPIYESFKIYGLAYTNAGMRYTNIDTSSPYYGQVMYHDQMPRDQWCYLPVTNMVNNLGIGLQDDLPTNTFPEGCFMVPTNANIAEINYQVYEYCPQSTDAGRAGGYLGNPTDAIYWDDMELVQVVRTPYFTTSLNGTNINLSFGAVAGLDYYVLYKTDMRDATWNLLTTTNAPMSWQTNSSHTICDYYPITVSDPITIQRRYYRVKVK